MLEITLLKTLFHEMDPDKIPEVRIYDNNDASKYHELAMELPDFPDMKALTVEARYGSHNSTMYYVHANGNLEIEEDIHLPAIKAAIYHFFKTYKPDFFFDDLPEDISDFSILECFDVAKIPDYRPKYAFPGLVTMEDIKNGTAKVNPSNKPTFPGLRMLMGGSSEEHDDSKPAFVSNDQKLTEFEDKDDFNKKMEALKKQFNIDALLNK